MVSQIIWIQTTYILVKYGKFWEISAQILFLNNLEYTEFKSRFWSKRQILVFHDLHFFKI